jgi:hypothetical protein
MSNKYILEFSFKTVFAITRWYSPLRDGIRQRRIPTGILFFYSMFACNTIKAAKSTNVQECDATEDAMKN